jgi:hypothetical protein
VKYLIKIYPIYSRLEEIIDNLSIQASRKVWSSNPIDGFVIFPYNDDVPGGIVGTDNVPTAHREFFERLAKFSIPQAEPYQHRPNQNPQPPVLWHPIARHSFPPPEKPQPSALPGLILLAKQSDHRHAP